MKRMNRREWLAGSTALAAFLPLASACAPAQTFQASPASSDVMDGTRMAQLIANGDLTAGEAIEAAIARAETVEPQLNAIANKTYGKAREAAASTPDGAFGGVPSFTKDLSDRMGEPTLYGSRAFEGYLATKDDPHPAAWRAAGIVSLGKSTTPEMGLISSTEPLVTGPTRNPWDLSRMPGGSSGGAASLVAARVVPFADASDGGGSIRIPASCCGLFGLKPSARRLDPPLPGVPVEISVHHAVTLTVRDSVALFRATEGNGEGYAPLGAITGPSSRRLRIAFAPEPITPGAPLDGEVRTAVEDTAELCRELGHEVVDYRVPFDGAKFLDQFLMYWAAGAAEFAQDASDFSGKPIGPDIVEPWTLGLAAMFQVRQSEFPDIIAYLKAFEFEYAQMFDGFDVLLTPTLSQPPVPIGEQAPDRDFDAVMESVVNFAAYTAPMNVAGAASMSVPLGWTASGLPVGSMFSGRRGDDGLLFQLAYELEAARPWIEKVPPIRA